MTTFQLPSEIQEFAQPTLFLVFGHISAKAYLAKGNSLEVLTKLHSPDTEIHYSDKEGFSAIAGTGGMASQTGVENHNVMEHYERVFLNFVKEKIDYWFGTKYIEKLVIFVPEHIEKVTKEKIPKHILANTTFIIGNFVYFEPIKVIEKYYEEIAGQ